MNYTSSFPILCFDHKGIILILISPFSSMKKYSRPKQTNFYLFYF